MVKKTKDKKTKRKKHESKLDTKNNVICEGKYFPETRKKHDGKHLNFIFEKGFFSHICASHICDSHVFCAMFYTICCD